MAEALHTRRLEILKVIARAEGGEPPTERGIGRAVGLKSSQTVHHHLRVLEEERYVERGNAPSRKRRPVRLTERGWEAVGQMPVMGRIAAGRGLEAVSAEDEVYLLIPEVLLSRSGKPRYVLRVVGDSMIGAHIGDGDILIVEENEDPPDGTVVAALVDGEEVTVKRLYRRGGDLLLLKPQNGNHEDIVVPAGRVEIQGEVVLVMHPPRR